MSFSTLNIGASALTAAQRAVEVSAHNIANSTVDGYTRQRLELAASAPGAGTPGVRGSGMRGTGVQVVALDRLRGTVNDLAVRSESATAGSTSARADVLDRAQGILGPYADGVPKSLTSLWDAFSALAQDPSGPAARQATVDAASSVAEGLNDAAGQLTQIRSDTASQVGEQVKEVNSLTKTVADLNQGISDALSAGSAPNDLLDSRDLALDKLAALTGATSTKRDNGMVDVSIGGERVVNGTDTVELVAGSTPPPAGYEGDDPVVQIGTGADARTITTGGQIGGEVSAAGTDLRDVEHRLNELTSTVADTVNTAHEAGYDLTGTAGGPVFVGSTARTMTVSAALVADPSLLAASGRQVSGGVPLDGQNAAALAGLRASGSSAYPDGVTLNAKVVGLATLVGSRAADSARSSDAAATSLDGLTEQRDAANGVSIDDEMVDLVRFQHSYDAASRVVSIANDMLDTLINRMGVS